MEMKDEFQTKEETRLKEKYPLFDIKVTKNEYSKTGYGYEVSTSYCYTSHFHTIDEEYLDKCHKRKEEDNRLMKLYPNLYFFHGHCWTVKVVDGKRYDQINVKTDENTDYKLLNTMVEKAVKYPNDYFWCTNCSQTFPMSQFEASVMAGFYCKECARTDYDIGWLIERSKDPGFYN